MINTGVLSFSRNFAQVLFFENFTFLVVSFRRNKNATI